MSDKEEKRSSAELLRNKLELQGETDTSREEARRRGGEEMRKGVFMLAPVAWDTQRAARVPRSRRVAPAVPA
ncbi:hypothetical protein EYF80_059761 [Liparis tanakae]|uniref:Uncharacterized protein n=1 Tax=Liparis tanakae TaxID=230148 RepID=A0A4Z2EMT1_9TELE|nr:hypothetical protein EYF80_059761 [Liparis tanakae]